MNELVAVDKSARRPVIAMLLSEQGGATFGQGLILVIVLALGAAPGFQAVKRALDRRSECTAESIQSMTVGGRCAGDVPPGAPPAAPSGDAPPAASGAAPRAPIAFGTGSGPGRDEGLDPVSSTDEPDGPALADPPPGPLEALPFSSSVAVSCTAVRNPDTNCKDRAGVRVQATGEVTIERSPTKLDVRNDGCPLQELSVQAKLQVELNGKFKGKAVSGSLSVFTGEARKFTVKVSPNQADAIARGERPPPNPVDPTSLLPGESIELSEEFFTGNKLQGTFKQLQLELGFEEGRKLSVGVKRVDANTVRIFVGDAEAVRNSLSIAGSESDASLALGGKEELSKTKVRSVEIDISTPEGHAAYQEFLATGKLPPPGARGTKNAATTESVDFTDQAKVEGKFKNVKVGKVIGDVEGNAIETKNEDGSVDFTVASRNNDVGFAIKETRKADGSTESNFTLLVEGGDPKKIENFEKATGKSLGADANGNFRLDFTEGDLENIRQQAIDQLHKAAQQRGIDISRAELERLLREDPDKLRKAGLGTHPSFEIAAAQSPAEVLQQLAKLGGPQGDPNRLLDNLNGFVNATADARNGRGARPKDNANSAFPGTPRAKKCEP
jgi:hypothetical protein